MKSISLLSALVAATLFILPTLRAANSSDDSTTSDEAATSSRRQQREAELLKRFDKNGDGKIDENEKAEAKIEMLKEGEGGRAGAGKFREQLLKRFDKNNDGKLDETERAEAFEALKNNPRFIKRFDKNQDGKLDEAELATARSQLTEHWMNRKEAKKKE